MVADISYDITIVVPWFASLFHIFTIIIHVHDNGIMTHRGTLTIIDACLCKITGESFYKQRTGIKSRSYLAQIQLIN